MNLQLITHDARHLQNCCIYVRTYNIVCAKLYVGTEKAGGYTVLTFHVQHVGHCLLFIVLLDHA